MSNSLYYSDTDIPDNILQGKGDDEEIIQILKKHIFTEITQHSYCGSLFHIQSSDGGMYIRGQRSLINRIKKQLA